MSSHGALILLLELQAKSHNEVVTLLHIVIYCYNILPEPEIPRFVGESICKYQKMFLEGNHFYYLLLDNVDGKQYVYVSNELFLSAKYDM